MGDPILTRVRAHADRHDLLPPGAALLAMVSGGPDSMCLLHALHALHDGPVGVLTVDHGLRAGSGGEAEAVCDHARALGLAAWCARLELTPGAGLQERARDARRSVAADRARRDGFDRIATGHTASDQAETVLFRIARGTGRTGALGIRPGDGPWIRPLLILTRDETAAWCRARGIPVVDDPSNRDPRWARSRVRHGLLAALDDVHPGAALATARFAELLRDEADALAPVVDAAWERCASGAGLAAASLAAEPTAIARLLVRRLLDRAGLAPDRAWVDRALALAAAGGGVAQAEGGIIAVDRGTLVAEPPVPAPPPATGLGVPGEVRFGARRITARLGDPCPPSPRRVALTLAGPLTVGGAGPGDRVPLPGGGHQAVGRLLAAAGVPARHRPAVPVVRAGERVVWVAGYRADPSLLAPPGARATVLEVSEA